MLTLLATSLDNTRGLTASVFMDVRYRQYWMPFPMPVILCIVGNIKATNASYSTRNLCSVPLRTMQNLTSLLTKANYGKADKETDG